MRPCIKTFFDEVTSSFSYVVYEAAGSQCAIIDSVLGYDAKSGRTNTRLADIIIKFIKAERLEVQWLLETHAHADHLSAAAYIKKQTGGLLAISEKIRQVKTAFKPVFNIADMDDCKFDYLFKPDESFYIGNLAVCALEVPGHTPADIAYVVEGQQVFIGDTLFQPDVGTARCDFPGGDAAQLYQSIQRLLSLPEDTRLYMCHDYPPADRDKKDSCTVAEQRAGNIHVKEGLDEASFIKMRNQRDAQLELPNLIIPAIQINIRAGQFPPAESNGTRYIKVPLDIL
ncbi:MAG: MBL fold metallo-hydrolase [Pontibacterium sp.]